MAQSVGNVSLNATTLILNFGLTLLLSHELGPGGYGVYAFAFAFATLLAVPSVLGLTPLIVREIASYRVASKSAEIRALLSRANQAVIIVSSALCLSTALACWLLEWPGPRFFDATLLALLLVPVIAITSVRQGAMQGFGRVVLGRTPEALVAPALLLALAAFLALALGGRFSATWAIGANVAAFACAAALGVVLLRRTLPSEVRLAVPQFETRRWVRGAAPLVASSVVLTVNAQAPTVLLGALSGASAAGIYGVSTRIANLLPFLLIATMPVVMPAIAELNAQAEHRQLQRLMTRAAKVVFLGSLPLGLAAIVFAGPVLRLFGGDFSAGSATLRILAAGQLVNVATGFPGTILIMIGATGLMILGVGAGTLVGLVLAVLLIPGHGSEGAAIATAASLAISNILLAFLLWRQRGIYSLPFAVPGFVARFWRR